MTDRTEKVKTSDGPMDVFVTHPAGSGPFPVVIQLMDALGMRDELRDHARRTASWGYYVIAPDLFHRSGVKGPIDLSKPEGMEIVMAAMKEVTGPRAASDLRECLAIADRDGAARKGKIGIYGFCMGGRLTLMMSETFGERVGAGASIHPGGLVTDDPASPHKHIDHVSAELYFGIADNDASATPAQMETLEAALKAKGVRYQLEMHPNALHGYMMPSRSDLYQKEAAEKVWGRLQALFGRTLK